MIFDTIESVLKTPLNDSQQENFNKHLSKSKLSRLSYGQVEISPRPEKEVLKEIEKINTSFESEKQTKTTQSAWSPFRSDFTKPTEELTRKDLEPIILEEQDDATNNKIKNDENSKELKSPSDFYFRGIILSPEEKESIQEQDRIRRQLFENAKRLAENKISKKKSPESEYIISLKKQQKVLKEESNKYKIELEKTKTRPESIQKISKINEIQPYVASEIQQENETNVKQMKEFGKKVDEFVEELNKLYRKIEAEGLKNLLDENFQQSIRKNIDELLCLKKEDFIKNLENVNLFKEIEVKYVKILKDLNDRVERALSEKQRVKQEEERQKQKEQEERFKKIELKNKFSKSINEFKKLFQDLKIENEKQDSNLESKSAFIQNLANENLIHQTNNLKNFIRNLINHIDDQLKNIEKFATNLFLESLNEKLFEQELKHLKDKLVTFKNQNEDIKTKTQQIENDVQKSLDELIKAKKAKEELEAEKLRLEKAKELEQKMAEKALKEKLEKEAQMKLIQKQQEEKKKLETVNRVQNVEQNNKAGINSATLVNYEKVMNSFNQIRKESEDALNVREFKMYKFDLQKAINFPLNSLLEDKNSEENRINFDEKIKTLVRLFSGQNCTITSTLTVSASKHPKAIDFCLVYLARKLVEKGEETVASRPETAFQYCQVIIEILKTNPKFETILMGQLQERCPYVVPYYKQRTNGQSDEQYFESLGYKLIDGKIEEDVHFYKRMSGVLVLYFTLLLTANGLNNLIGYFNLKKAWQWLADTLNMTPRPNTTAEMLAIYFKCTGYQQQKVYGKQFVKLVEITQNDYLNLIRSISSDKQTEAAVGRLQSILNEYKKYGRFNEWKKPN